MILVYVKNDDDRNDKSFVRVHFKGCVGVEHQTRAIFCSSFVYMFLTLQSRLDWILLVQICQCSLWFLIMIRWSSQWDENITEFEVPERIHTLHSHTEQAKTFGCIYVRPCAQWAFHCV